MFFVQERINVTRKEKVKKCKEKVQKWEQKEQKQLQREVVFKAFR